MAMASDTAAYNPSRRRFLVAGASVAGALVVGFTLNSLSDRLGDGRTVPVSNGEIALNAWLKIDRDGYVTVMVPRAEMGQGVHTALAALVAEELDADWDRVRVEQAPVERIYGNVALVQNALPVDDDSGLVVHLARAGLGTVAALLGLQVTGGSTSIRDAWQPMREAGATARAMLVQVAAERWNLLPEQLLVRNGVVEFPPENRKADYAALVAVAARLGLPSNVRLKPLAEHRLIGAPVQRLDIPAKINGTAMFAIDARAAGLLYASIRHVGVAGERLQGFDAGATKAMSGVRRVVRLPNAVAVVADSYWRAHKAAIALVLQTEVHATLNDEAIQLALERALRSAQPDVHESRGEPLAELTASPTSDAKTHSARYQVPYLAHACMEPMNCTVRLSTTQIELWIGHQAPSLVLDAVNDATGLSGSSVILHQTYLGGGFGRRVELDAVRSAIAIAKAMPGETIQLIYSREEDLRHDVYRPAAAAEFEAKLDLQGLPQVLRARLSSSSVVSAFMARVNGAEQVDEEERSNTEGVTHRPYAIEHVQIEHVPPQLPIPVGFWRSVGYSQNSFFYESFIDELASVAGIDPFAYRKQLLKDAPAHLRVLATAARAAGWDNAEVRADFGRGIALVESFGSIVAQVVEVDVVSTGAIQLRRVVCAVDCGIVVNPDQLRAQMESSIVFGLSAALFGEINFDDGSVRQSNFHDYPVLRMRQMPEIEVHIVKSLRAPGGAGEPGTPPSAPALANAIFAATGERLRSLPLLGNELRIS